MKLQELEMSDVKKLFLSVIDNSRRITRQNSSPDMNTITMPLVGQEDDDGSFISVSCTKNCKRGRCTCSIPRRNENGVMELIITYGYK